MGGGDLVQGEVTPHAEFNFYRDPSAAADCLLGPAITVVSLDVTNRWPWTSRPGAALAVGQQDGEQLSAMVRFRWPQSRDGGGGRFVVHDPLTIGTLLWPELFLRSKIALQITTEGPQRGRSKPTITKDKSRQVSVVISVDATNSWRTCWRRLCQEEFVVLKAA